MRSSVPTKRKGKNNMILEEDKKNERKSDSMDVAAGVEGGRE